MQDLVIVLIIIIALVIGVKETMKHMRGEGACCGGSSAKPKKKKLKGKILHLYTFTVEGMHCVNCAYAVTRAINEIDGALAKVDLKKKSATVQCDREIDTELIIKSIEKRGYKAKFQKGD
ncbi:MAG: heavy-metal-associated domain-containing protein [Lachnospiraceae bacterium]|nr:heavy-metal-associated domain-containing protein [Lachnospiraceae bacterium]